MTYELLRVVAAEPEPVNPAEALLRNRALQQMLADLAVTAAEARYPDIRDALNSADPERVVTVANLVTAAADLEFPGFRVFASDLAVREVEIEAAMAAGARA